MSDKEQSRKPGLKSGESVEMSPNLVEGFYIHEQEFWDEERCAREARRIWRDGMGTPGPRGLIQPYGSAVPYYGRVRFNGGTSIDGCWYPGYYRPYPRLAPGYKLESHPAWGVIIKKENADNSTEN